MDDWDSLRAPLEAACESPEDEDAVMRAVDAAELVASTAGEPPDELPEAAREWVETHGVPPDDLVALPARRRRRPVRRECQAPHARCLALDDQTAATAAARGVRVIHQPVTSAQIGVPKMSAAQPIGPISSTTATTRLT